MDYECLFDSVEINVTILRIEWMAINPLSDRQGFTYVLSGRVLVISLVLSWWLLTSLKTLMMLVCFGSPFYFSLCAWRSYMRWIQSIFYFGVKVMPIAAAMFVISLLLCPHVSSMIVAFFLIFHRLCRHFYRDFIIIHSFVTNSDFCSSPPNIYFKCSGINTKSNI